jgi:Fic family protein
MKLSKYVAGKLKKQNQYSCFSPSRINHEWSIDNDQVGFLLSKANILLGELNGFSKLVPDVDFFIKMHVFKEATNSSQIEGTQTNIDEAIQKIENIAPEKRDDWIEVSNYVDAMNYALNKLNTLPLCNRLLKDTHKTLMQGARGETKKPGEFRTSQNWIGGSSINDALFVPPCHTEIPDLMRDLESFLHNDELLVPPLIKIAIAHYQFEAIHPFLDGNGRTGRLLVTLFLVSENILRKPVLYLSDYLFKYRSFYYDNLNGVSHKNDMVQWLKFFLEGVIQTSQKSINTLEKIIDLKTNIENTKITQFGKKTNTAKNLLFFLFKQPVVDVNDIMVNISISNPAALRLVNDFVEGGILKEITGYKRNRAFSFDEYLGLFR